MAVTPNFNPSELVRRKMEDFNKRFEKAVVYTLNAFGMELVSFAREHHNYKDRTGNLTNSISYVVVKGKQPILVGGEQGGGDGANTAVEVCHQLASRCTASYTLIIVAGMNYAYYVERKGYNVLIPAELKCDAEFVTRMKNLISKYDNMLAQQFEKE